ncbi:MAG: glycosyltransferase [Proteobacteria bacterium]|nr:glycosyltransferase [Pseudomonadota bacterium]MBU1714535.1 glycosyltransferase [Pseudomonadota bacterium]
MVNLKISIITISYNSAQYIEQTIQSVVSQTCQDKEYIVVDGGSTDGTIEIIKKYEGKIDKWVSGPDKGIADAMNKGLALASGDFVMFLHSDDYFVDEFVLSTAASHLSAGYEIFLFNIFLSNNGESRLTRPRGLNWWMNLKTGVFHQSAISARSLFERIGNFDTGFRIAMDYDFFLRAYRAGAHAKIIDFPLSVMRLCGVSSQLDWASLGERFAEEKLIHIKNCSSFVLRFIYFWYWLFYPGYRYCKSRLWAKS